MANNDSSTYTPATSLSQLSSSMAQWFPLVWVQLQVSTAFSLDIYNAFDSNSRRALNKFAYGLSQIFFFKKLGENYMLQEKCNILDKCSIVNFPKITDFRGNLSFIEENKQIPFEIKRVYYLYDVPSGATRGGHAHKALEQMVIALSGSFDVILDDGYERRKFFLNRPHYGLYISPGVWRELENFSSNSVALSLVSQVYDESDYVRDYEIFKRMISDGAWK